MTDPMDHPPVDHGSDRYDYIELIDAPPGKVPMGQWYRRIAEEPCPDCRANVFLTWTGRRQDPMNSEAWSVKIAHDDGCPTLARLEAEGKGG